ncbi:MAG TPA: DUF4340 domain-containing protein [Terriglobales bacterium]
MKFNGLLIAAAILLVLTGALYYSNHHKPADDAQASLKPAAPKILTLSTGDITRIDIKKPDSDVAVAKNADKWQIVAPQPLPADQTNVNSLAATLSDLNSDRLVEEKANSNDLTRYGLAQPAIEVSIAEKDNKTQKLLVGDTTPTNISVYAKLEGDPRVFTIATFTKTALDKTANDLRDTRLLPVDEDKISRLELVARNEDIEFGRDKDRWQILKPKPARADGSAVDELVTKLTGAKMELGPTDDPKKDAAAFASSTPVATAKVTTDSGTQQLELRKNKDDYYAKSSAVDGVYKVAADLAPAFDKKLDDFRDKNIFDFGYADPDKIEIHDGANTQYLTKGGNKKDWFGPDGKKLDAAAVTSLLGDLRGLQATKFADSGFTAPDLTISITANGGKNKDIEKVSFAKSNSNADYLAQRANDPTLYVLAPSSIDDLRKAVADVKPEQAPKPASAK